MKYLLIALMLIPTSLSAADSNFKRVFFMIENYRSYNSFMLNGNECLTRSDYLERTCNGMLEVRNKPRILR